MIRTRFHKLAAVVLCLTAGYALAQDGAMPGGSGGITVFPASFYIAGEPATALDIASRTPGFTLDQGNSQLRGLESAAGNVLIDGRRPTTKTLRLSEVLAGIPFASVERAELIRAGTDGYDLMGQRVVLNIVRRSDDAPTFIAEGTAKAYPDNDQRVGGSARFEYSQYSGAFGVDASLEASSEQSRNAGEGNFTYDSFDGAPSLSGTFNGDDWDDVIQGIVKTTFSTDRFDYILNLTASDTTNKLDQSIDLVTSQGDEFSDVVDIERGWEVFEAGADVTGQLTDDVQLNVKLLYRSDSRGGESSRQIDDILFVAGDAFDASETAARGMLRWQPGAGLTLEAGAEAAYNELDSLVTLTENGVPVDLPNADITVAEDRYVGFANATWQANTNWLLELGVDYETSTLTQSGDANLEKNFDFLKPKLVLTRSIGDSAHLRLRYEKVVGQLNFNTFAASPSLDTGIISAGNAELEPEESRDIEIQFEKRFWDEGSAILTYVHTKVDNALDYIPVGDFDALGNAGPATKSMLVLDLALPFDRFGWSGATFRPKLMYLDSEITDPFTGLSRQMSSRNGITGSFGFTWELPDIQSVIGVDGFLGYNNYAYRISEERRDREVPGALSVWWDKTLGDSYTLRVEVHNLTQQQRERYRDLYADGRASGVLTAQELRMTAQEPHLILKLRKRF